MSFRRVRGFLPRERDTLSSRGGPRDTLPSAMSRGGFGSATADERTAPLLEQVVGRRTSPGRGVATILSLAESRARAAFNARAAFRSANQAALEGAEKLSEFTIWRRDSLQSRGSLKPRSSMDVEGPGLSWLQVALTVWSSLMGTGIVALPYALAAAGWAGLLLICAAAAVTAYTGKLLAWSLHTVNSRKRRLPERYMGEGFTCTYDQLAKEVLGPSGGMLMQVLTLLECLGSAVCLIVLQAANWPSLIELQLPGWLSPSLVVALTSGACSYALLLLDGRALSRLGAGCHLLFAALLCIQFGLLLLIPPPPGAGPPVLRCSPCCDASATPLALRHPSPPHAAPRGTRYRPLACYSLSLLQP